jgi:hypothetical protein
MTKPTTEITTITLHAMRAKLDEAATITRAAEALAADGQLGHALVMALDVEPLAMEADQILLAWRSNGRWGLNCAAGFFPP